MNGDLKNILINDLRLSADRLTPGASLDDAGFDSLAVVELSVLLRDRFGINVADADIKSAGALQQLDDLIQRKRDER